MTTIATHSQQHKVPIATGLAVACALAAGGFLGVAWESHHNSQTAQEVPALQPIPSGEYWKTNQYHPLQFQPRVVERGSAPWGGVDGNTPPTPPTAHTAQTAPSPYGGHVLIGP